MSKPSNEPPTPTKVEAVPQARQAQTQKALGQLAKQAASLARPTSTGVKATQRIQPGGKSMEGESSGVGLRQAVGKDSDLVTADIARQEKLEAVRRVQTMKDEHRQKVWEKLDTAKRSAEAKAARLKGFNRQSDPERGEAAAEAKAKKEDFDF